MNGEKNMTEEKVHPNSTRVEIKNLSPISINYVHILAYNSRFNGPTSQPVHFNTLGESKYTDTYFMLKPIIIITVSPKTYYEFTIC